MTDTLAPPPPAEPMTFDGATYLAHLDRDRLTAQVRRVLDVVTDGNWRTLAQLAAAVGASEASVSARLRDLRKERFGGWTVERQRAGDPALGLHKYRVLPPPPEAASGVESAAMPPATDTPTRSTSPAAARAAVRKARAAYDASLERTEEKRQALYDAIRDARSVAVPVAEVVADSKLSSQRVFQVLAPTGD